MLKIAVPNKGSLAEPAADMLREAGYALNRATCELFEPLFVTQRIQDQYFRAK